MASNFRCLATITLPKDNLEKYETTVYKAKSIFLDNDWSLDLILYLGERNGGTLTPGQSSTS